jgi:hypothetical protein
MSDAWEDLGYHSAAVKDKPTHYPTREETHRLVSKYRHEDSQTTENRREKVLAALSRHLSGFVKADRGFEIELVVAGRRIVLWPSSDTYYLESKQRYGTGIEDLCAKIKAWLNQGTSSGASLSQDHAAFAE